MTNTSATDRADYRAACENADIESFRSHPMFTSNVETVPEEWGPSYMEVIRKSPLYTLMGEFARNDDVGGPRRILYDGKWTLAATTLRYIHVMVELLRLNGDMRDWSVCEIGVGYGGQFRIADAACDLFSYTLVDTPPALALTRRFLGHFHVRSAMSFQDPDSVTPAEYDLVVSNFAFSEMTREMQKVYLDTVIFRAKHGYMMYNSMVPRSMSLGADEVLQLIPRARIIPDVLHMPAPNQVIAW